MAPTVSVLMTVYNRARYLAQAVDSVLKSSWTDFELIIVDDCSTDGSLETISNLVESDQRARVVVNSENLGDYGNRMKTASLARGEFIKYVDSDDLIYDHSLAVMVKSMRQNPDAALGLAHSLPEDESPYPWRLSPAEAYAKHFLGRGCMSCGPSGAIIRRSAFEQIGGFHPEWGVLSDSDLWFRIAARYPIVLLPPGLVWWRRHVGQEFSKEGAEIEYLRRGFALEMRHLTDPESPLPGPDRQKAVAARRCRMARRVLSIAVRSKRPRLAHRLYRSAELNLHDLVNAMVIPNENPFH